MSSFAASTTPELSRAEDIHLIQALRDTPLLRDLPEAVMTRLAAISKIVDAPAEAEICRQGDAADELIIVLDGQLAGFSTSANGTTAVVEVIRSGETLGTGHLAGASAPAAGGSDGNTEQGFVDRGGGVCLPWSSRSRLW